MENEEKLDALRKAGDFLAADCMAKQEQIAELEKEVARLKDQQARWFAVDPQQVLSGMAHEALAAALDMAREQGREEIRHKVALAKKAAANRWKGSK